MHYSEIFNLRWSDVDHYRIPSLIVTKKGTVLAFCNNRRDSGQDHAEQVDLICLRKPLFGEWEERTLVSHEGWSCHIGSASYDGASGDVMCTFGRSAIPIHEWKDYTDEERRQFEAAYGLPYRFLDDHDHLFRMYALGNFFHDIAPHRQGASAEGARLQMFLTHQFLLGEFKDLPLDECICAFKAMWEERPDLIAMLNGEEAE